MRPARSPGRSVVAAGAALLVLLAACAAGPADAATPGGGYVALGDSYVAGPGIPDPTGAPLGCGRSTRNYPALVNAEGEYPSLRDVSCGGATLADLTGPQSTRTGTNPPQLAAACRDRFTHDGHDVLAERVAAVAPGLADVLGRIRRAAPHAAVLVVGYPVVLPRGTAGCAEAPYSPLDLTYLNEAFGALDDVLERAADAAGAHFVDIAAASVGHDVCASDGRAWIEGEQPRSPTAPFHPNADGMRATASAVRGAALVS
jgi:hypothetical protein